MTATRMVSQTFDQTWRTPRALYVPLDHEFHFDYDPCPPNPEVNGIFSEWGGCNFVNPPYGRPIAQWLRKGLGEMRKGKISVFLLPAYTDVAWFHDLVLPYASEIRFLKGRLKFGDSKEGAPFASMLVIFKPTV